MSPEMSADASLSQVGEQHGEEFLSGNNSTQRDKSMKTSVLHPERRLNQHHNNNQSQMVSLELLESDFIKLTVEERSQSAV